MGRFILDINNEHFELENTLTQEGADALLAILFQAENTVVPVSGGNFYLGFCGIVGNIYTTLATLGGEPSVTNGYARAALPRTSVGWPTLNLVNGTWSIQSKAVSFTPTGSGFTSTIQRAFLCSAASGSTGKLFALSTPLPQAISPAVGVPYTVSYTYFLS